MLRAGPLHTRWWMIGILWLSVIGSAWAAAVDTNPMNYDPQVRAAFKDFYNLDYSGAVQSFERYHAAHPGDPQATAYLLNATIFQELYSRTCWTRPSTRMTAS